VKAAIFKQMLDPGCWIYRKLPMVKSENIGYQEAGIQYLPGMADFFAITI
jgi:hypothetical protein